MFLHILRTSLLSLFFLRDGIVRFESAQEIEGVRSTFFMVTRRNIGHGLLIFVLDKCDIERPDPLHFTCHAPRAARGIGAAAFAGEGHQLLFPAAVTA